MVSELRVRWWGLHRDWNGHEIWSMIRREWLLLLTLGGAVGTSLWLHRLPRYSLDEIEVLYVLFVLFITTNGLKNSGAFDILARRVEQGRYVAVKMTLLTFFLAMVVTNDVSLLIVVPLTISLQVKQKARLVSLEALAANAGSAITPFGNPQNLFIYWLYGLTPEAFIKSMWPFGVIFITFLLGISWIVRVPPTEIRPTTKKGWSQKTGVYGLFLVVVILVILRLVPMYVGLIPLIYVFLNDRRTLRVDYGLLLTFFFFFGWTDNLSLMFAPWLQHVHHTFLIAVVLSQILSNVPTTLLLMHNVSTWPNLLWGVNVGGFGSLVGSLANLIAYRIYTHDGKGNTKSFLLTFSLLSYLALAVGIIAYVLIYR